MILIVIAIFWLIFLFVAKGSNLLWFPLPLAVSYLLYQLVTDMIFEISDDYLFLKTSFQTKKIHAKDLLDFLFRHSVDAETGISWHFSINTMSKDFYCDSPIPFEDCLSCANILIKFFEKHKASSWSGHVTSKNDILHFDESDLTINDVRVSKIDFRRGDIIDPVVLIDKNNQEYILDLMPALRDFYIFKAYFSKKIELQFSFKTY